MRALASIDQASSSSANHDGSSSDNGASVSSSMSMCPIRICTLGSIHTLYGVISFGLALGTGSNIPPLCVPMSLTVPFLSPIRIHPLPLALDLERSLFPVRLDIPRGLEHVEKRNGRTKKTISLMLHTLQHFTFQSHPTHGLHSRLCICGGLIERGTRHNYWKHVHRQQKGPDPRCGRSQTTIQLEDCICRCKHNAPNKRRTTFAS